MIKQLKKGIANVILADQEHGVHELEEHRLSVCQGCEKFNKKQYTCGVCGCFMDIKAKLLTNRDPQLSGNLVVTHCPLGKWGLEDAAFAKAYKELKEGKVKFQ